MVYENNKNYLEAIKFYKKFMACAKLMEDKIGMALGANRIAVNYFYNNTYDRSIDFHKQNLSLSDQENLFAGYYNLGIAHRKTQQFNTAVDFF